MIAAPPAGRLVATALLALLALAAALTGETVSARARATATQIERALTVQVLAPHDSAGVARASEALRRTRGVMRAAPMDAARAAQLLQGRGGGVDPADVPPLHLIEVLRAPEASDAVIAAALRSAGVRAELHSGETQGPARTAIFAEYGGAGAAALLLLAIALLHAGAGREAGVAADLGAPRGAVLAAHGRSGAVAGFAAGGVATAVLVAVAAALPVLAGDPLPSDMLSARSAAEIALVLLAPLAAMGAATLGARAGAARAYDSADRLA